MDPKPDKPEAKPSAETYDLETLAGEFGQLAKPAPDGGKFLWRHNVASFLHGWQQHEYHNAKPVMLTKLDYAAALACVDTESTHAAAVRKAS